MDTTMLTVVVVPVKKIKITQVKTVSNDNFVSCNWVTRAAFPYLLT
jgi:hypothetical protein